MIIAVLQARMSSSRLPGKVLKPILGEPMLWRQIERLMRCKNIDQLIVATSTDASDDALAQMCEQKMVHCYRGSLDDVLGRFYQATNELIKTCGISPDHIVRLTGDCPLADPELIDLIVSRHLASGADYTSNVNPPTYADGLDVEIFTYQTLQLMHVEALLPSEREHVTPYVRNRPQQFKLLNVENYENQSKFRWTVDNPEDFEFVSRVYHALYPINREFTSSDILSLLQQQPELQAINRHIARNEGMKSAIEKDKLFLKV